MPGAKHETMRSANTALLLNALIDNGPMTRQALQKQCGLSWGAVSNIVSELILSGVLCETVLPTAHAGRKPSAVAISSENNLCIGVDVHMQGISCVITDLAGHELVSLRRSIDGASRQQILDRTVDAVREAMNTLGVPTCQYIGIGVSVQGSIDATGRISLYSPHLPDWNNVPLCDLLETEFNLPALLIHDTFAMILAERRYKEHCAQNMAFIKLDMGLGMSMVLNGQLYTGSDGNASEFGHIIINPEGPLCTCGNHGCLEAYASGRSLLSHLYTGIQNGRCQLKLDGADFEHDLLLAAQAARDGSAFELQLFERMGQYLGIGISNLINFINPELVIIGGELCRCSDLYLESTMRVVQKNVWNSNRIQIALSMLGRSGAAVGAAVSVLHQVISGQISHPIGKLFRGIGV